MMKQYIFKLLWVAVPALIFCVFSSWVLYKGGELKTLDRVVEEMAEARKQGIEKLVERSIRRPWKGGLPDCFVRCRS